MLKTYLPTQYRNNWKWVFESWPSKVKGNAQYDFKIDSCIIIYASRIHTIKFDISILYINMFLTKIYNKICIHFQNNHYQIYIKFRKIRSFDRDIIERLGIRLKRDEKIVELMFHYNEMTYALMWKE